MMDGNDKIGCLPQVHLKPTIKYTSGRSDVYSGTSSRERFLSVSIGMMTDF